MKIRNFSLRPIKAFAIPFFLIAFNHLLSQESSNPEQKITMEKITIEKDSQFDKKLLKIITSVDSLRDRGVRGDLDADFDPAAGVSSPSERRYLAKSSRYIAIVVTFAPLEPGKEDPNDPIKGISPITIAYPPI